MGLVWVRGGIAVLLSSFIPVERTPTAIGLPSLESHPITMNLCFAQVVAEQGGTSTSSGREAGGASVAAHRSTWHLGQAQRAATQPPSVANADATPKARIMPKTGR
ncbi:hypothetical protein SLA2020_387830 [Shorea laevis]